MADYFCIYLLIPHIQIQPQAAFNGMRPVVAHTLVRKNEGDLLSESPQHSALSIVDEACRDKGWRSVARWQTSLEEEGIGQGLWLPNTIHLLKNDCSLFLEPLKPATFWTFARKPPVIKRANAAMSQTLPEWGKLSHLEEVFETRELPGFQSTCLKSAVASTSVTPCRRASTRHDGVEARDASVEVASRKRRRDIFASDSEESNFRERDTRTTKPSTPPIILVPSTFRNRDAESPSYTPFVSAHLFIDLVCAPHHLIVCRN